jgi:hypothetical protein
MATHHHGREVPALLVLNVLEPFDLFRGCLIPRVFGVRFFREVAHVHCLVRQIKKQWHVTPTSSAHHAVLGVRSDDPGSLRRVESGTVLAAVGDLCTVVEVEASDRLSQGARVLEAAVFDLAGPAQALVVEVAAAGRETQAASK